MKPISKYIKKPTDDILRRETLSVLTAAILIAENESFDNVKAAIETIKSAIDAGSLSVKSAAELAKARGDRDEALRLTLRRLITPVKLLEDEQQTIMTSSNFVRWLNNTNRGHLLNQQCSEKKLSDLEKELELSEMDQEVFDRINALIIAYKKKWQKLSEGAPEVPSNLEVATEIQNHCNVNITLAKEGMARTIRPSWAKDATGGRKKTSTTSQPKLLIPNLLISE